MKLDLLAHQDIGQRALCRPQAQKVPPTRHTHMVPDIGMHGFHIGICMLHIGIYGTETLKLGTISYQISVYTDIESEKSTISGEIS